MDRPRHGPHRFVDARTSRTGRPDPGPLLRNTQEARISSPNTGAGTLPSQSVTGRSLEARQSLAVVERQRVVDASPARQADRAHREARMTFRRRCAAGVALLWIGATVILGAAPAWAHGGEANEPARDLLLTAVAVLEAHPSGTALVEDKINDALDSTEPGDVNLDLVRRARDTLATGDLEQTTLLLEQAIGACPGAPVLYIPPGPRKPAAAEPCPTPVYVRGVASRSLGGTAEPVLLVAAVLLAVAGGVVLRRVH